MPVKTSKEFIHLPQLDQKNLGEQGLEDESIQYKKQFSGAMGDKTTNLSFFSMFKRPILNLISPV